MAQDPDAAPATRIVDPDVGTAELPEEIEADLTRGRIAAVFIVLANAAMLWATAAWGAATQGFDAWSFIDLALMAALTAGIGRRSRISAVLLLVYFAASRVFFMTQSGENPMPAMVFTLALVFCLGLGARGAFAYQRWLSDQRHFATLRAQRSTTAFGADEASR